MIPPVVATVGLLVLFMTIAWYAHLKNLSAKPWYVAALVSWGIALVVHRLGYRLCSAK